MPIPRKNEAEKEFISRCVGDLEMKTKFPDNKQRLAVCYSYFSKTEAVKRLREKR